MRGRFRGGGSRETGKPGSWSKTKVEDIAVDFDPRSFLDEYAAAYNTRDRMRLGALFALGDPRFSVYEEFSGELMNGNYYGWALCSVVDARGEMSFELVKSDRFGDFALVHAIQTIASGKREPRSGEGTVRATLWISLAEESPRIVSAHFSSMMLCFPKRATILPFRKSG